MKIPAPGLLFTDLYQLTMLQAYFERGMEERAVFEFFVRKLPPRRGFLLAAGLEQLLEYLESLALSPEELAWLEGSGLFKAEFLRRLERWRFTGDVHAMAEGTVFFPDEPIVRVTAPLPEAQLVESRLINILHFQTLIASKAARVVLMAPGKLLVDFGMRRAHGAEAAILAARASYLAGFSGTSTVLAAPLFDIPIYGTMAHSFIQAHESELEAFERFAASQPGNVVLLLDTYDTERAAHKVVEMAARLQGGAPRIKAVRLDSGDLAEQARMVRRILDAGGLSAVQIFSSGNLDEEALRRLAAERAPIDGFGVGTRLDTAADAPYLDCAYKLEEYAGLPRRKRSEGKSTWPGPKQVFRRLDESRRMAGDVLALESETAAGEPLLQKVMAGGKRLGPPETLLACRRRAARQLDQLPEHLRQLAEAPPYPVTVSPGVRALAAEADRLVDRIS